MLHIETFSQDYKVRLLTPKDAQTVLKVESGNPQYYFVLSAGSERYTNRHRDGQWGELLW